MIVFGSLPSDLAFSQGCAWPALLRLREDRHIGFIGLTIYSDLLPASRLELPEPVLAYLHPHQAQNW